MTAKLSSSLQQADGVWQCRASEEPHIDMGPEGVYVPEACIADTHSRAPVVHQFSDVLTALPHALEPPARNRTQVLRLPVEPCLNGRVPLHSSGETEDGAHCSRSHHGSLIRFLARRLDIMGPCVVGACGCRL